MFDHTWGDVSYIMAAREVSVVLGALLGVIFLGERLTPLKLVSIVLILLGLVVIKSLSG